MFEYDKLDELFLSSDKTIETIVEHTKEQYADVRIFYSFVKDGHVYIFNSLQDILNYLGIIDSDSVGLKAYITEKELDNLFELGSDKSLGELRWDVF